MSYKPPRNPAKVRNSKVRVCDGIGGPQDQILKRFDPQRGFDISNTIVNDLIDFKLAKYGQLNGRNGARKINDTGRSSDIESLFTINIGNRKRYAVKYGETLEIIDIPIRDSLNQPPLDFEPEEERPWTVREVRAAFTVEQLREKTVRELITGKRLITTVPVTSYPGDPL